MNNATLIAPEWARGNELLMKELIAINVAWANKKIGSNKNRGQIWAYFSSEEGAKELCGKVNRLIELGLTIESEDYMIFPSFNGVVEIKPDYTGALKAMVLKAEKQGLTMLVNGDVICKGDKVSIQTEGNIDTFQISKSTESLLNPETVSAYTTCTIFRGRDMVFRKTIILPKTEFTKIRNQAKDKGISNTWNWAMSKKASDWRMAKFLNSMFSLNMSIHDDLRDGAYDKEEETRLNPLPKKEVIAPPANKPKAPSTPQLQLDKNILLVALRTYGAKYATKKIGAKTDEVKAEWDKTAKAKIIELINSFKLRYKVETLADVTAEQQKDALALIDDATTKLLEGDN